MKKHWTSQPSKSLIRDRQETTEAKRHGKEKQRERRARRNHPAVPYNWPVLYRKNNVIHVSPPNKFSLIDNPEETIEFLGKIRTQSEKGKDIFLDMRDINVLTHDAIAALISLMEDHSLRVFGGSDPSDPELRDLWKRSGFFKYAKTSGSGKPQGDHGNIRHRLSKKVEGKIAKELIGFATEMLYGSIRIDKVTYRTLLECMNNTHNHASGTALPRPWWATVYCKPGSGIARFTFIDNGVGIFQSVGPKIQLYRKIARVLGIKDNPGILRDVLKGTIPSSTGRSYRGKGLPMFYKDSERGDIKNLTIISNDAYANVSKSIYTKLQRGFRGTCIYWEVRNEGTE